MYSAVRKAAAIIRKILRDECKLSKLIYIAEHCD